MNASIVRLGTALLAALFLFTGAAVALEVETGDVVTLVERDIHIPAHPDTGEPIVPFRFVSGSKGNVLAVDPTTGWIELKGTSTFGSEAIGWITKKYIESVDEDGDDDEEPILKPDGLRRRARRAPGIRAGSGSRPGISRTSTPRADSRRIPADQCDRHITDIRPGPCTSVLRTDSRSSRRGRNGGRSRAATDGTCFLAPHLAAQKGPTSHAARYTHHDFPIWPPLQ